MTDILDGLLVPRDWSCVTDPAPHVVVSLTPRWCPASGYLPWLTVTRTPTRDRSPTADAVTEALGLADAWIEDEDAYDTDFGRCSYLRVGFTEDDVPLVAEIWSWDGNGELWTLTACLARDDLPDFTDVFDEVAETFRPP